MTLRLRVGCAGRLHPPRTPRHRDQGNGCKQKRGPAPRGRPSLQDVFRRCPTLPRGLPRSTIGAEGLNFRVRNGTGCFPLAIAAGNSIELYSLSTRPQLGSYTVDANPRSLGVHEVRVVSSPRPVSTGQLSTLRCLHFRPINPVVWLGALPTQGGGRPHLEACFPLRCFQRLSLPDVANQPCSWRNNWHTRGQSVPVLSY